MVTRLTLSTDGQAVLLQRNLSISVRIFFFTRCARGSINNDVCGKTVVIT